MPDKARKRFGINKYRLYGIVMVLFVGFMLGPRIWKAITFKRTGGTVVSITYSEYQGARGKRTTYYPVVEYKVNHTTFTCWGSSLQHDELYIYDKVTVIYDPANPAKAYVYSALGFWMPVLVFVIPVFLVLTLVTGLDIIPRVIRF